MALAARVRDHVLGLTTLLSLLSLAAVFGAALGYIPPQLFPRASAGTLDLIPHVNALISLAAIGVIAAGWRWIRAGAVGKHRVAMLTATGLFVAFLGLYLYKVILEGPTAFPGPQFVYQFVYLPLLAIHILLAIVCVPLVYYVLLLAATHPVAELPDTAHPRVGRVAASLWLISFSLGLVVYLLLYVLY
ncbi:MAG: DUF420 domain-containing protein [Halobacteriales archaeon]|nr:DUF420 domain-containing protein [Halobacteriales archaeon]